ncbi:hypothetical protein NL676_016364 [Syzygium grande]|nr:hypothetical protein NL676_016364 [Syzygium grande]
MQCYMLNTMSTEAAPSSLTVNPLEYLQITLNPDGTLNCDRFYIPDTSATPVPTLPTSPVLSKKEFCVTLAHELSAVVVSVEYRLALEHRLPRAYDDAVEALHWVKTTRHEWLTGHADLSTCYLMGSSAGGNLAFHAGLRASASHDDFEPLKI